MIIESGYKVSKIFKYYSQFNNSNISQPLPFERITSKSIYNKYKCIFDKIGELFEKYDIDVMSYLKFCILEKKINQKTIKTILSRYILLQYIEHEQILCKRKYIYTCFKRSVDFISSECIKMGYPRSLDYIRYLISEKKLATYYISGKISKYYLSAITNFPKVIDKLDQMSQDEFHQISIMYDKYHLDIKEAMIQENKQYINVFKYTDQTIEKKKSNNL